MNTIKPQVGITQTPKRIVILSGGTSVSIRPHFSICAPAYGRVGKALFAKFSNLLRVANMEGVWDIQIDLLLSRMAGGGAESFETNDDLSKVVDGLIADESVVGIVMAAAVCDHEPIDLCWETGAAFHGERDTVDFGKDYERLDSSIDYELYLRPAEKIVAKIKKARPDIYLASFKTTSNGGSELLNKSLESLRTNGSNVVLGNDIVTHENILVPVDGKPTFAFDRMSAVKKLATMVFEDAQNK